jgi:type IV secretory pathway TrbL component
MRTAIILSILMLSACSLKKDPNNNSMTFGYDSEAVENGTSAVKHEAGKIAKDIASDVKDTGSKIKTKIDEQTAGSGAADNAATNSTTDKPAKKH